MITFSFTQWPDQIQNKIQTAVQSNKYFLVYEL